MAVIGTFGSFTAARLGIYASQSSLNVTGNNIANINTNGYTRQRADLVSIHSYGDARYANSYNLNIGYGVLVDSVSQLRDPFLDIRYRNENSNVGAYETKLDCLQQMAHILDEVGKGNNEFGIVEAQFNDFFKQLENLKLKVGTVEYDTTVRGSAQTLTRLLNDYSKALDTLQTNKLKELKEDVTSVNTLLTQIRDLSEEIREAGIHGDKALELRDARNVCIDKLSAYMKIDVSYDMEKIDEFKSVERINISIADSGNPPIKLIQGIYGTQISMPDTAAVRNPDYDPNLNTSKRYISQESDFSDPANPKILYTHNRREALMLNGNAVTNDQAGETAINTYLQKLADDANAADPKPNPPVQAAAITLDEQYDLALDTSGKYLILDDTGKVVGRTDDASAATQVDNAIEGSDENRLWMSLEPLKDARGKYMRDQYHKEIKETVDLTDNQLYGSLQSVREFLTEKGEFSSDDDIKFDPDAAHKRGIQYYQKSLDALAKKFADTFNAANQLDFDKVSEAYQINETANPKVFIDGGGTAIQGVGIDGTPMDLKPDYFDQLAADIKELETLKADVASGKYKDDANGLKTATERIALLEFDMAQRTETAYKNMEILRNKGMLTERWSFYNGGVLFSNNGDTNDGSGINAGNITISKDWSIGDVRILNTKKADDLSHSTANDNILHMVNLMGYDFDYLPNEIVDNANAGGTKKYFTGSFQERLADMNNILAEETQTTYTQYSTYTTTALTLENSRQSVCGVDLNDEATNMMVFQKSYAAACQLMTTLDSMLDKLINGTIR